MGVLGRALVSDALVSGVREMDRLDGQLSTEE
jgi:hypothetical protein